MNPFAKILLVILALAVCAGAYHLNSVAHQPQPPTNPAELYNVVWQQIHALRSADYNRAYRQVSSTVQDHFTREAPMDRAAYPDLLRTQYPEVLRADRIEFGNAQSKGRHGLVQVYFIFRDGHVVPCTYSLIREDTSWKIDGARLKKLPNANPTLGGVRL